MGMIICVEYGEQAGSEPIVSSFFRRELVVQEGEAEEKQSVWDVKLKRDS